MPFFHLAFAILKRGRKQNRRKTGSFCNSNVLKILQNTPPLSLLVGIFYAVDTQGVMPVASLTLEIEIPDAHSLKDRRQVVRSLKDRLRHAFNLAIAELDSAEVWNRATLGVAVISSSNNYLQGQLREIDQAAHRIANGLGARIADSWAEMLTPEE